MKHLCYSILTLLCMLGPCNPLYKVRTTIHFVNNSDYLIKFTIPECYGEDCFPDTTMISYWPCVWYQTSSKKDAHTISSPLDTFEEWIPHGSECYSLFVFPWEPEKELSEDYFVTKRYFENDEYYVRYDLTIDDIRSLCDSDGILNISYPPSPEMRHIKMWPPYEDAIKNVGTLRP